VSRRHVLDGPVDYTIADDDPPRRELLPWAVLRTRVLDELTLQPPLVPIALTSSIAPGGGSPTAAVSSTARVADGGYCGVVARPRDAAYALVTPGAFRARVTAPGYLPRDLTPAIDAARRALSQLELAGTQQLHVNPPEPAPRAQFRAGRGVMIARSAPLSGDEFTTVDQTPPPAPDVVPVSDGLAAPRLPGTRLAGVPLTLPDQYLHRDNALRLRGRIQVRVNPTTLAPAAGANIGLRGIWFDYPSSTTTAPQAADLCAIQPSARASHPAAAPIASVDLNPGGPLRRTLAIALADAAEIVVAPTNGLNPLGGDVLTIEDPLSGEFEAVVTAGFDPIAGPTAPARIRLRTPLGFLHRPGAPVQVAAPAATVPAHASAIARDVLAGDAVLFGAGLPAFPQTSVILVDAGTARAAYYRATQYPAENGGVFSNQIALDATGRFVWPPLARVAQVRLYAELGGLHQQRDVALDYSGDIPIAIVLS
jgi:hypothetical protein